MEQIVNAHRDALDPRVEGEASSRSITRTGSDLKPLSPRALEDRRLIHRNDSVLSLYRRTYVQKSATDWTQSEATRSMGQIVNTHRDALDPPCEGEASSRSSTRTGSDLKPLSPRAL